MNRDRFLELEGVRGIAAIMVVVYHVLLIFYPRAVYGDGAGVGEHSMIESLLYENPVNSLFSGVFAVALFFVLSGFVLSIGFFSTQDERIIKKLASRRYLRLMIPALVSVLFAYILIKFGLSSYRDDALAIVGGGSLGVQWNFDPNIFDAIIQGIWSIFITGQDSYNRVLWTMHYEFFGSMLVFLILFVFGKQRYRFIVYIAVLVAAIGTWYAGFIIGVILADLYTNKKKIFKKKYTSLAGLCAFIMGIILGGYPVYSSNNSYYNILTIPNLTELQNLSIYLSMGAGLVIASIIMTESLRKIFSFKPISNLGKYTFSLYLTHMLVLLTITPLLFVSLHSLLSYNKAVLISVLVSIPIIIGFTFLFERWVDRPAIRFGVWAAKITEHGYEGNSRGAMEKAKRIGRVLLSKP